MVYMNKKGFTLIELLAVIIILGILSSLAVISYVNYLNNTRDKAFKVAEKDFASALEEAYVDCLDKPYNNTFCSNHTELYKKEKIYLSELVHDNYIDVIKNPYNTDENCDISASYIQVSGERDYDVCLKCGNKISSSCD